MAKLDRQAVKGKGRRLVRNLLLGALAAAALWLILGNLDWHDPVLNLRPEVSLLGPRTEFVADAGDPDSGLRDIRVIIRQDGQDKEVMQRAFPKPGGLFGSKGSRVTRQEIPFVLDARALGLKEGKATLKVQIHDHSWRNWFRGRTATVTREVVLDLVPLEISFLGISHLLKAGGTGAVAYRVSKPQAVSGVMVGEKFFPGFPMPGKASGEQVALVALPRGASGTTKMELVARDQSQEKRVPLPLKITPQRWRQDSLSISEGFVTQKVAELKAAGLNLTPGLDPLEAYLEINRKIREANHRKVQELCVKSRPERLWEGAFLRMPNSKPMARFGDTRTYKWQGKAVDRQVHLGEDLASLEKDTVPAANTGVVVLAEFLGIYGLTVILDHGWGVFSMYSHLSEIQVKVGDKVDKGNPLGRTGTTGLAGGDHLHFAIAVSGEFVNPVEWWDAHWIKDQVLLVAEGKAPAKPSAALAAPKPGKKGARKKASKPPKKPKRRPK